nr:carbohydrate kinase [Ornithinibacillus californiensis]
MEQALNENEQKLFTLIRKNPFISQQELADEMNLSRPSVANLISGLIKKGYIQGKAYVVNDTKQIVSIGGANVDRKFYVQGNLKQGTSNPIKSTQSVGGVARNVAENLGRLGINISMITANGMDAEWSQIEGASSPYMNLAQSIPLANETTGSYTAVIDQNGELVLAFADMAIYDSITPEILQPRLSKFAQAKCLVADLNLPAETISFIQQFALANNIPLVLITVSAPKMERLPKDLQGLTWLITNRDETETFFNVNITDEADWEASVQRWLDLGIENVVVTNGKKGALIGNNREGIQHIPALEVTEVRDVTGAGDAFSAAVIYAWLEGESLANIAKAGAINSAKTIQTNYTVRQDLSAQQLRLDMEELQ